MTNLADLINKRGGAMQTYTSSDAKREFGEVLIKSQLSPISVTRNGKPIAVIVSDAEYTKLRRQVLAAKLIDGEQSGDAGSLDIENIKLKAREKLGINT